MKYSTICFLLTVSLVCGLDVGPRTLSAQNRSTQSAAINSQLATNDVVIETVPATAAPTDAKTAVETITRAELEWFVRKLADDSFEGREAGSRGGRAAGNMLVEYFARYGLQPMGDQGSYFQQFNAGFRNIIGFIPGSDPDLRNEFIMLGAHYDHVGYGTPRNSYGPTGYIHNGADDNGSGTATLIEVMQAVSLMEPKPARSIAFALWDAEEKGLLGSKDWVQNQLNDPKRIKLYINMDMVGRLRNEKLDVFGVRSANGLRRILGENNLDDMHLNINWKMREDSDHYSFWQKEVPAIMLHSGLHDQYHRPSDDADTVNFDGMLKVARYAFGVLVTAANQNELSGFRRESWTEGETARIRYEATAANRPGRLGVKVIEASDGASVQITGISSGSPAEAYGLQTGDRILSINDRAIRNRPELISAVRSSPAQSSLQIIPFGRSEPLEKTIQLRGEKARIGIAWRADVADPSIVLIVRVDDESPAGLAGARAGDRIYKVNGRRFANSETLGEILKTAPSPIELEVENIGRMRRLSLNVD